MASDGRTEPAEFEGMVAFRKPVVLRAILPESKFPGVLGQGVNGGWRP